MSILEKVNGKRVLVTGSKGFIGSGLPGDGIDLKDGVDIVTYRATKNYDVVIHTAALTSVYESMMYRFTYFKTNVVGTANLIQQHPKAHFIYLSTAAIYGEGEDHTVESPAKMSTIYPWTKLLGEYVVQTLARSWCVLRLTNVMGPGGHGVHNVFEREKELPIYGDGLQTRDFIHVDKVRKIIMQCFDKKGICNVGSGVSKTILEVAKEFNKPIKHFPPVEGEIRKFGVKDAVDHIA